MQPVTINQKIANLKNDLLTLESLYTVKHNLSVEQENAISNTQHALEKLCEYMQSEEKGILIKLPCKVGDKVYIIDYTSKGKKIFECTVMEISISKLYGTYIYFDWGMFSPRFVSCTPDLFGKKVFATKEEAKKALESDAE